MQGTVVMRLALELFLSQKPTTQLSQALSCRWATLDSSHPEILYLHVKSCQPDVKQIYPAVKDVKGATNVTHPSAEAVKSCQWRHQQQLHHNNSSIGGESHKHLIFNQRCHLCW